MFKLFAFLSEKVKEEGEKKVHSTLVTGVFYMASTIYFLLTLWFHLLYTVVDSMGGGMTGIISWDWASIRLDTLSKAARKRATSSLKARLSCSK